MRRSPRKLQTPKPRIPKRPLTPDELRPILAWLTHPEAKAHQSVSVRIEDPCCINMLKDCCDRLAVAQSGPGRYTLTPVEMPLLTEEDIEAFLEEYPDEITEEELLELTKRKNPLQFCE